MVNMITSGKQKVTGKTVLLFSGGMDSLMFDYLMNPDVLLYICLLYTSPSPRDATLSRMPSSA